MQQQINIAAKATDKYIGWKGAYEKYSERKLSQLIRTAVLWWTTEREKALKLQGRTKSKHMKQKYDKRYWYCNGQINRWQNSYREQLIHRGLLVGHVIPF